ncbi:MAG: DUF3187 family protein [Kiritimatiellia bacterium]
MRLLLCLTAVLFVFPWYTRGEGRYVPVHLEVRSVSPGPFFRPSVTLPAADPPGRGAWKMRLGYSGGNLWIHQEDSYLIDGEWYVADLRVTYGLASTLSVSAGFPGIVHTGGVLDRPIEAFHNAARLGNAGRENHPRNRFVIEMKGQDGQLYVYDETGFSFGDIPLYATWYPGRIFSGGPDVLFSLGMTLPTGDKDRLSGLGVPVYGGSLLLRQALGQSAWGIFVGGGFSYTEEVVLFGNRLRRESISGITGISCKWRTNTELTAQYMYTSAIARKSPTFSRPTHEVHVGGRYQVRPGMWAEVAFLENVFDFSNSMDVGFSLALHWML